MEGWNGWSACEDQNQFNYVPHTIKPRIIIRMKNLARNSTLSLSIALFGLCSGRSLGAAFILASRCRDGHAVKTPNDSSLHRHRHRWRRQDQCLSMIALKKAQNLRVKERDSEQVTHQSEKPKITFDLLPDFMQKDPLLVTKQRWRETSSNSGGSEEEFSSGPKRQKSEMMVMSAITVALAVGVVFALASSGPDMIDTTTEFNESGNVVREILQEGNTERLEVATRNIVKTVLPQSAEDVIAVSIGEGIAGAIGAFATWLLRMVLSFKTDDEFIITPINEVMKISSLEGTKRYTASERMFQGNNMDALVSEAVADGDYFLTRAAAQPLLEAVGIPIFFASLASILIATLPYEAVKLTSQKRRRETEEQKLLEMLLEEEESRRRNMNVIDKGSNKIFEFIQQLNVRQPMNFDTENGIDDVPDMNELRQQQLRNVPELDYIELFADITKWLEYDVLISNYRGILTMPNGHVLSTGVESAIFG